MNAVKTTITTLLLASLSFPATLFGQNAQQIDNEKVYAQAVETDSTLSKSGIRLVNTDGTATSLATLMGNSLNRSGEMRVILPANDKTHLVRPLGILFKKVSTDGTGINLLVAYADAAFSNILTSQVIKYNFSQSSDDNNARIRIILQKMGNDISSEIASARAPAIRAIVDFFIPRAEASSIPALTILNLVFGFFEVACGITLGALTMDQKTIWRRVVLISGAISLGVNGIGNLSAALSLDDK
jgi:hypothetical protein